MKLIKVKNYKEISGKASGIVIKEVKKKPNLVIGFATGKTPLGLYKLLVNAYKKGKVDFSKIKAFNLDEYYPIKKSDKRSFYYYLHKNFFDKVNVKRGNVNLLNGETKNPLEESRNYESKIKKKIINLMILGVGINGHIAFNEPGSLANSRTRLVELTNSTKRINKINKKALTMGISTIMKAKKLLLLASGKNKAKAIECLVKYKPNSCCPVSFLKKHKNLVVIVDKEAGRLM